jgi:hypothetical protein
VIHTAVAERTSNRRTADRATPDVLLRFACASREHLAIEVPGRFGHLVNHHGTFGYCPARTTGPHEWKDVRSIRLSELRRTEERPHLGY